MECISALTGSVTGEEEEGHAWLKLPFALLLRWTEHGAVSTSHGLTQLVDQVPAREHATSYASPTHVNIQAQASDLGEKARYNRAPDAASSCDDFCVAVVENVT